MLNKLQKDWDIILDYMMKENNFTPISYEAWVKYFRPHEVKDNRALIVVEKSTIIDSNWFMKKYKMPLRIAIMEVTGLMLEVEIIALEDYKC